MDSPLGVCAWIFGDYPLPELLDDLVQWGYDGLEVAGEPDVHPAAWVRAALHHRGLRALGVTASCDWPTDSRDLANPDAGVRRRAIEHFRRCIEFGKEVGAPFVCVLPAAGGRFRPLARREDEWRWSVDAVREVATYAQTAGIPLAVEALNRYETHLVTTAAEALRYVEDVATAGVGIVLDIFHMQIEEADPIGAIRLVGDRLLGFHLADSNRAGLGYGHLDLMPYLQTLRETGYRGPLTLECTAPGPDPFQAIKDPGSREIVRQYARESLARLRGILGRLR